MRSERVLEALRAMTSLRALVIWNGIRRRIPGREVVRGDLVVVGEGDRVPADAMLLDASELMVDGSLLTGESAAVAKRPRAPEEEKPRRRAATTCRRSIRARWSCAAAVLPRSTPRAPGRRSVVSASRSPPSTLQRRASRARRSGWCAYSRSEA